MKPLIAHRGSHECAPENTLEAFAAAAAHGADMIEFDVRRTADGQLAIFHDAEVARQSVNHLTLAQLRERSGVEVPVLDEVLDWAADAGIGLDVELKEAGYVDQVAPRLSRFDGEVMVTSFLDPVLADMAQLAPEISCGLLLELTTLGALERVAACRAQAAVIKMRLADPRLLADLAGAGYRAYLWDFRPDRHLEWLFDPAVDGFITDDVPGTRRALAVA